MKISRNTVKSLARLVVVVGTTKIVNDVIDANTPPPNGIVEKTARKAGTLAVGGVVATSTAKYSDQTVDALYSIVDLVKAATPKK